MTDFKPWQSAVSAAPWGIQQGIKSTLELAATEDIKICYGADSKSGSPCLINALNPMISDDQISPAGKYPAIVRAFDTLNGEFFSTHLNGGSIMSPLVAEVLLRNLPPLKDVPEDAPVLAIGDVENFLATLKEGGAGAEIVHELMDGESVSVEIRNDPA